MAEREPEDEEVEAAEAMAREADDLPPIDFCTFVVSLRTSAMLHLSAEASERNLPLARQEIDLLGLLEEKTRGNLSGEEERLLSQVLFDLRTRYVAARARETSK